MSSSHTHKLVTAAIVAAFALALGGCGSGDAGSAADGGADAQATGGGASTPTAAATATAGPTGKGASEATDFAPVDVKLANGTFTKSTPSTIHVPAGFLLIVTAKNSGEKVQLSVQSPSTAQTFKIAAGGSLRITLDSLESGESAKLMAGGRTVKVSADAEPGP